MLKLETNIYNIDHVIQNYLSKMRRTEADAINERFSMINGKYQKEHLLSG